MTVDGDLVLRSGRSGGRRSQDVGSHLEGGMMLRRGESEGEVRVEVEVKVKVKVK